MSGGRAPPGPAGGAYALPQKPKLGQPLASTTKYFRLYLHLSFRHYCELFRLYSKFATSRPLYSTAGQCALAHLQLSNYAATGAHRIFFQGRAIGGGRGQWLGRGSTMASAEHEPITGVWRQSPQRGPGTEPLVRGRSPAEAESILVIGCPTEPANLAPLQKCPVP